MNAHAMELYCGASIAYASGDIGATMLLVRDDGKESPLPAS